MCGEGAGEQQKRSNDSHVNIRRCPAEKVIRPLLLPHRTKPRATSNLRTRNEQCIPVSVCLQTAYVTLGRDIQHVAVRYMN